MRSGMVCGQIVSSSIVISSRFGQNPSLAGVPIPDPRIRNLRSQFVEGVGGGTELPEISLAPAQA